MGSIGTYTVAAASEKDWRLRMQLLVSTCKNGESLSCQMITQMTKLSGLFSQWLAFRLLATATKVIDPKPEGACPVLVTDMMPLIGILGR